MKVYFGKLVCVSAGSIQYLLLVQFVTAEWTSSSKAEMIKS